MTQTITNPPSPVPAGLTDAIEAAGHAVSQGPDGWTVSDAVAVQAIINAYDPLPYAKQQKLAALAVVYAGKIAAGYLHADGHTYQLGPNKAGSTGVDDLGHIAEMANNGTWPASGGFVRDVANVNVPKDAAGALDVAKGASAYVFQVRAHMWSLKDAINAAADLGALAAIDVTAGWP